MSQTPSENDSFLSAQSYLEPPANCNFLSPCNLTCKIFCSSSGDCVPKFKLSMILQPSVLEFVVAALYLFCLYYFNTVFEESWENWLKIAAIWILPSYLARAANCWYDVATGTSYENASCTYVPVAQPWKLKIFSAKDCRWWDNILNDKRLAGKVIAVIIAWAVVYYGKLGLNIGKKDKQHSIKNAGLALAVEHDLGNSKTSLWSTQHLMVLGLVAELSRGNAKVIENRIETNGGFCKNLTILRNLDIINATENTTKVEAIIHRVGIYLDCRNNAVCIQSNYTYSEKQLGRINGFAFVGLQNNSIEQNRLCIQKLRRHDDDVTNGLICDVTASNLTLSVTLEPWIPFSTTFKVVKTKVLDSQLLKSRNRINEDMIKLWLACVSLARTKALNNSTSKVSELVANTLVSVFMTDPLYQQQYSIELTERSISKVYLDTWRYMLINLWIFVIGAFCLWLSKYGYNTTIQEQTMLDFSQSRVFNEKIRKNVVVSSDLNEYPPIENDE